MTTPRSILRAAIFLAGLASWLSAAPPALTQLTIETGRADLPAGKVLLSGRDAWQQLLVTGRGDAGEIDVTRDAAYDLRPAGIAAVDATGLVTPLAEGTAVLTARAGGKSAQVEIEVTRIVRDVPVSFANQVVPLFTKYGCNGGGCHGKAEGQNGFKLSLLGFEPQEDYEFLVREARGRRLFPAAPDRSLLLQKATGALPHGGGQRFEADSPPYRLLRRWIDQGSPAASAESRPVERIEVLPRERTLGRNGRQQLTVIAHLAGGETVDVTRMAQFEVNQPELAAASVTGLVSIADKPGIVAVMIRYQAHVAVFRGIVPLGAAVANLPPPANFIDEHIDRQLMRLGLPPSGAADDGAVLRRATIDIAGRLPTLAETEEYLADARPDKQERLIDRLLASDDYAAYFAMKWSAVLRNRRRSDKDDPAPTAAFHAWIREQLKTNTPFDRFARQVLTAQGEAVKNPPAIWYREVNEPSAQLEDMAQLFLGQRIQCARCHHHPLEKWSQHDYYGLAAIFSRTKVKLPKPAKKSKKNEPAVPEEPFVVLMEDRPAQALHPRTGEKVPPTALGGAEFTTSKEVDPREQLADWMAAPDNPFFARTLTNRYWKHFFGRGLVEPEDDLRVTNPATNPELLDALATHFIRGKFDLKDLVRTICLSRAYARSAQPNEHNADDRQNHSRFLTKRLHAEVLLDAIDAVTLTKTNFKAPGVTRAVELPDNMFDSYFLAVFGRPESASACECERSSDVTLAQMLQMFNSADILAKVAGPRAQQLAKDKRPHAERLRDLYLAALSRPPTAEESAALVAHIEKKGAEVQAAYEDILWALLNTKEFMFNH